LRNRRSKNDKIPIFVWQSKNKEKKKRGRRIVIIKEEKIVRWAIDNKEDWKREEIEKNHRKIEEMVPEKFLKWRKVFEKVESKRMPMRKVWDHVINLKNMFIP